MNVSSLNQAIMPPSTLTDYEVREADGNRWSRYRRYLDFYNGRQWEDRPRPGERRIIANYSRTFILKQASYLFGSEGLTFNLIPNGTGPQAEQSARVAEDYLRQVWTDNGLSLLDYDTAIDAAVMGDGAFKVTLQPTGDVGPLDLDLLPIEVAGEPHKVVVQAVDVMGLSAKWRGDDMRRLLSVTETWRTTRIEAQEMFGIPAVATANLGPGVKDDTLITVREYWDDDTFKLWLNNQPIIEDANNYGFIPYIIFPNLRRPRQFWGESDLVDILTLNSELNVRISTLSSILQLSGNPILVLENVEDANGLRVGPGAVWTLPENSKAYLLDLLKDGGLNLHMQYIEALYRILHDLSEMPRTSFGEDKGGGGGGSHSGVAIELTLQPLIQKVLRKRQIWTEVLDRRNRMILRLAGLPVYRSNIEWPNILPKDRAGLIANEIALVEAGIHTRELAASNLGDEQPDLLIQQVLAEAARFNLQTGDPHLPNQNTPNEQQIQAVEGQ
jgi:hypothetical protein